MRRRIGYVAQSGSTDAEGAGRRGARRPGPAATALIARRGRGAGAAELVERLDLDGHVGARVRTLSGGQRRRLDIAMGLVHAPRLLFLDEPSTGLDPQSRANLWEHIRGLRDEHGTTVFLTTHYLDEADALCDRILVIDHGASSPRARPTR